MKRRRASASRPQTIDDTLNDAYGQRQITQYFTQLNTYWSILEIDPKLQSSLASLDRIYVKSPLTGGAVPLLDTRQHRFQQGRPAVGVASGPVPGGDAVVQSAAGLSLGQAVDAITKAATEIGMPSSIIGTFQGNAQAFQTSLPASRR